MSVMALRQKLTAADIDRLVRGETPEDRAAAAHKVCRRINVDDLDQEQRRIGNEILTILAGDTAALVRRTLAVTLRNSPHLPRETALRLARDIEGIATPVLKNSPNLTDADLIELIEAGSPEKQLAMAERERISETVSEAMTEHGDSRAVKALITNEGATIGIPAYDNALKRFSADADIHGAIIGRERIPPAIAEKLLTLVTGELFDNLINRHELPPKLAMEIAEKTRERATLDLIEQAGRTADPAEFVSHLRAGNRLSPALICRAMCLGHVAFVEHAFAALSGLPHRRVWMLLHDSGPLGLRTLLRCSNFPRRAGRLIELAVATLHETELDPAPGGRERFRRRMIERVLTYCQTASPDDVNYLLDKLDALDGNPAEERKLAS